MATKEFEDNLDALIKASTGMNDKQDVNPGVTDVKIAVAKTKVDADLLNQYGSSTVANTKYAGDGSYNKLKPAEKAAVDLQILRNPKEDMLKVNYVRDQIAGDATRLGYALADSSLDIQEKIKEKINPVKKEPEHTNKMHDKPDHGLVANYSKYTGPATGRF